MNPSLWRRRGVFLLFLLALPALLVPVQDLGFGFGIRDAAGFGKSFVRRTARRLATEVVSAALAGVSTSHLQTSSLAKQVRQIEILIDQKKRMLQNAESLTGWDTQIIKDSLLKLDDIAEEGEAIAYSASDLDESFREAYPGYDNYWDVQRGHRRAERPQGNGPQRTYADLYRDWSKRGQDSIRGALRAAGLQSRQFKSEIARQTALENQLMNAEGTKQALQAGSLLASHQVSQLQKLRQLLMSQLQVQGNYNALQLERQALDDAALMRFLAPGPYVDPNRYNQNPFSNF